MWTEAIGDESSAPEVIFVVVLMEMLCVTMSLLISLGAAEAIADSSQDLVTLCLLNAPPLTNFHVNHKNRRNKAIEKGNSVFPCLLGDGDGWECD